MRKLDEDQILTDDDTIEILCECGSEMTIMANEEDICSVCDKRYYAKMVVEVFELEKDESAEDIADGEAD